MALSRTHNQVSDVAASLLNVLSCASSLGLRARGGRTLLQTDESKNKPPTTIVTNVCPSHSRFQPISADIERSGKPSKDARFRALKAVARVRIPSGLQGEAPSQARFRGLSQVNHLFPVPIGQRRGPRGVHRVGHHVQPIAEQVAVLVERHRRGLVAEHLLHDLDVRSEAIARLAAVCRSSCVWKPGSPTVVAVSVSLARWKVCERITAPRSPLNTRSPAARPATWRARSSSRNRGSGTSRCSCPCPLVGPNVITPLTGLTDSATRARPAEQVQPVDPERRHLTPPKAG